MTLTPDYTEYDEAQLKELEAIAEDAYDKMYDSEQNYRQYYATAKDAYYDAIELAAKCGQDELATRFKNRLIHIKNVFRSQFS